MTKTLWKVTIRAEGCDPIREFLQFQQTPADSAKRMFKDAWTSIRYENSYCEHPVHAAAISYMTIDPETGEVHWKTVAVYRPHTKGWYRPKFGKTITYREAVGR